MIPSVSPSTGGPAEALGRFATAARPFEVASDVLATDANGLDRAEWAANITVGVAHILPVLPMNVAPGLALRLARDVRDYDCVHLHGNWQFHSLVTALACHISGRPLVIRTCGGLSAIAWARRGKRAYLRFVERHVFDAADVLHYTTQDEATESAALIGARTSVVLPPPAQFTYLPRAAARDALGLSADALIALFVGRLDRIKRCELLVRAIALAPKNALLVLVGPDWGERAALEHLAQTLSISDRVRFEGPQRREVLQRWYAAADCFALASVHENFGLAAAEACASGLPCVLPGRLPVAKELGDIALRVDDTPEAFALAFGSLSDGDLRQRLGAAALSHAQTHWSPEVIGRQLRELYELAIQRKASLKDTRPGNQR